MGQMLNRCQTIQYTENILSENFVSILSAYPDDIKNMKLSFSLSPGRHSVKCIKKQP